METMQNMAYINVRHKLPVVIYVIPGISSNLTEGHGASIFKSIKLEVIGGRSIEWLCHIAFSMFLVSSYEEDF